MPTNVGASSYLTSAVITNDRIGPASPVRSVGHSQSIRQFAAYLRVSPRKVRSWIRLGLLRAIDVGCGRQLLRLTPDAIREFEQRMAVKPPAHRPKRQSEIDPEIERLLDS